MDRGCESGAAEACFQRAYDLHHRTVYAYLLGQASDRDTAADLLQETFVRVWTNIETLRAVPADRRLFWILRVAGNLARDWRRRSVVRARLDASGSVAADPEAEDPPNAALVSDMERALDRAIADLPDDLRLPFVLSVVAERSSREIGAILECPAGTIRYRIAEARKRIARAMSIDGAGAGKETES